MKKICTLLACFFLACTAYGQVIDNPGMETWRSNSAGTGPVIPIAAPTGWYGFDSLVIAVGEAFGSIIGAGDDWKRQVYQENTLVHGGAAAAKLITVKQDTLGFVPGMMSNAQPLFDAGVLAGGGDPADAIVLDGGTPTTLRPTTVSAWVAYFAGKDAVTGAFGGPDQGSLTVQSIATVDGEDSVVGTGIVNIAPSATYVQVTANVTYVTTAYNVHTVRIIFASGGGATGDALDSSMLYVDDVAMTGEPQSVRNVSSLASIFKVFPNPSNGTVCFTGPVNAGYTCTVASVTGQVVASHELRGAGKIDISAQPAGLYIYTIADASGAVVQSGKINIAR